VAPFFWPTLYTQYTLDTEYYKHTHTEIVKSALNYRVNLIELALRLRKGYRPNNVRLSKKIKKNSEYF